MATRWRCAPAVPTTEHVRGELALLLSAAAVVLGWWWTFQARELVDGLVGELCRELGLQRLDEAVSLERIRLVRGEGGAIALERLYGFEFSQVGDDRRHGRVCLLNRRPCWAHFEHRDGPVHIDLRRRG